MDGDSFCFAALYPQGQVRYDSAWQTYLVGNILLAVGVVMVDMGMWRPVHNKKVVWYRALIRFLILYILGAATVCIWHGIWYFLDYFLIPESPVQSYWTSTGVGLLLCYGLCSGASGKIT